MRGISIAELLKKECCEKVKAQLKDYNSRRIATIAQHNKQDALVKSSSTPESMVHSDRTLLVRITRYGGRTLDDDNLSGGIKELRDAIASAFGRHGDSAKDGFTWEYEQKNGD